MTLKEWRQVSDLTLAEAASLLAIENARTYQRYETGENRPDAPLVELISRVTQGRVTVVDLHDQRLAWLRANKPDAFKGECLEAAQ